MKKINWSNIFSIVLIMLLTFIGCVLIDGTWCYEIETAIVWSVGIVCVTEMMLANKFIRYLNNRDNK